MKNKIPQDIPDINVSDAGTDGGAVDYDLAYNKNQKRHRNTIEILNHWFNVLSHPFVLLFVLLVLGIAYLVVKYVAISSGTEVWIAIAADLKGFMSYVATFVFSFILSWFLEHYKNTK